MVEAKKARSARRCIDCALIIFGTLILVITSAVAVVRTPTSAPVISLVTRGTNSLKIDFADGKTTTGKTYQYSLDAGATWHKATAKNRSVTVASVPAGRSVKVSLRSSNSHGLSKPSKIYGGKRAIFLGASITLGSLVSGNSWARKVSSTLGWQYANLGSSGSGFMRPTKFGADCKGFRNFKSQVRCGTSWFPDVVIISGGFNDCWDADHQEEVLKKQILSTFKYTKAHFPDAEIIATPVITTATNPCLRKIGNWMATSAASTGIEFVAGADLWLSGKESEYSIDGVHPNLKGHNYVARQFVNWYSN